MPDGIANDGDGASNDVVKDAASDDGTSKNDVAAKGNTATVGLTTFWVNRMIDETKEFLGITVLRTLGEHERILVGAYALACQKDLPAESRDKVVVALGLMLLAIREALAKPEDAPAEAEAEREPEATGSNGPVLLSFARAKADAEMGGTT